MEPSAGYDSDVGSKVISEVVLLVILHTSYLWISRTLDCRVECSKKEMRMEWERSVGRILKDREDRIGQGRAGQDKGGIAVSRYPAHLWTARLAKRTSSSDIA
jgi:hypothetical protein